jgi:hypothetical protein
MYNKWIFPDSWQVLVVALCSVLHQRLAWRLSISVLSLPIGDHSPRKLIV